MHNRIVGSFVLITSALQVRRGEETDWSDASAVATGHNETVYSVTGLHPFSVFSFKVVAVNGVGLSRESEQSYYMITLRERPSGKPTITSAHNTTSSSIYLAWEPPHPSTLHGEFLGYQVLSKLLLQYYHLLFH